MKQGRHYNKKKKRKNTLKEITMYVTGIKEDNCLYEAEYQRIKRIRSLLKDSISIIDFNNMEEEYGFITTMIEFVYKYKDLEKALINFKNKKNNKDAYIDIKDYYLIVEALDNANVNKKYLEKNIELNNLYRLFKSIIGIQNQYEFILSNVVELFQYDEEKAISYAGGYRDTILMNTDKLNKQIFFEISNRRKKEKPKEYEEFETIKISLDEPVEEYEYNHDIFIEIDCKGQYAEDIDLSKYRNLRNVMYINLKERLRNNQ